MWHVLKAEIVDKKYTWLLVCGTLLLSALALSILDSHEPRTFKILFNVAKGLAIILCLLILRFSLGTWRNVRLHLQLPVPIQHLAIVRVLHISALWLCLFPLVWINFQALEFGALDPDGNFPDVYSIIGLLFFLNLLIMVLVDILVFMVNNRRKFQTLILFSLVLLPLLFFHDTTRTLLNSFPLTVSFSLALTCFCFSIWTFTRVVHQQGVSFGNLIGDLQ